MPMKPFRTFSLSLIAAPIVLFACLVAVNLTLDPDQIFFKTRDYPFFSRGLTYYKNAGIINQYDVKNIILGGSLMDNVIPSELETAMGWHDVYTLTLDGSNQKNVYDIATYAMSRHNVQNVLLCLQPERLANPASALPGMAASAKNFNYLYDSSRLNDLMVFLQEPRYFIKSASRGKRQRKAINAEKYPGFRQKDLLAASKDLYAHYMSYYTHYNRPLFISSLAATTRPPALLTEAGKQNMAENFDRYIAPLLQAHSKTSFYIIIPPGTFLSRYVDRNIYAYGIRFLVEKLSQYPNVKIHGFSNEPFNADLRLYTDLDHFHIEAARFIIQALAHDSHRLTPQNVDEYISRFNQTMAHYKLPEAWQTDYYAHGDGPYPKKGYITYQDAAKLVWGEKYSDKLYSSIPRSPYLDEKTYVKPGLETDPPL